MNFAISYQLSPNNSCFFQAWILVGRVQLQQMAYIQAAHQPNGKYLVERSTDPYVADISEEFDSRENATNRAIYLAYETGLKFGKSL